MTNQINRRRSLAATVSAIAASVFATNGARAQDTGVNDDTDVIVVRGIRQSLSSALQEKRDADNLLEVIQAEDIGKLPDQNLAEVLENITGIQIDRTAGVGTAVQIRGTGANRVEINGVSTVNSGNGRSGISFDDLPAALIASVEVTKSPTAQTVEGSVGGTINLRTIRALDLNDRLLAFRAQAERSDLADNTTPRVSGTAGNQWSTSIGDIGVVVSGSYAELDVASFDPRFDRDREVLPDSGRGSAEAFPFLRTQFLDQDLLNFEYETLNFTGSVEYEPTDNLKFYFDATVNDQERVQQSARAFFSGTGSNAVVDNTTNTSFETVDLGTIEGPNGDLALGEVQAVLTGILGVGVIPGGGIDSNLRTTGNSNSRVTESRVFALGGEWRNDRLDVSAEVSRSESESSNPGIAVTLDFINPRGPQPVEGESADNGIPAIFDASGGTLQFGIAPGLPETPTTAELLDPANYALRTFGQSANTNDNSETAFRFDVTFDTTDMVPFFSSFDAGLRWNENTAENNEISTNSNFSSATTTFFRPTADLFADVVTAGPNNFNAADDRTLFVPDYLIFDPRVSADDPASAVAAVNAAISANNAANGVDYPTLGTPSVELEGFFDIQETTTALYAQGNYDILVGGMPVRGNIGVRWVNTEIDSIGNNVINGVAEQTVTNSSYDFLLPRWNLVAEPREDLLIRAGATRDLRRPNFDELSTSLNFGGGANTPVIRGNPALEPETVWSYDISAEYYLSEVSFVSIGFFHKRRDNLFGSELDNPASPTGPDGQIERDITDPCEEGGIFNPNADRNVFSSVQGVGICVPLQSTFNVEGTTTQTGVELGLQYELTQFEDRLGWMSGFGFIGNFTYQDDGGDVEEFRTADGDANALNELLGRTDVDQSTATLDDDVVQELITLQDLSNLSFNTTLFYDKHGVNFRARYTWRSDFQTDELISFGLPRIVDDRGQLNASLSYAINDNLTLGIEGINLIREDRTEWCVNDDALLCAQGLTDRRIIAGASVTF